VKLVEQSTLVPFARENLDILLVGLNPAKGSSRNRHYFSVNQAFWNQLYDAGLITTHIDKSRADEIVFGSTHINFQGWWYGITDLITDMTESDSKKNKAYTARL
jgi:G:T/U-mismatch repair DNA glycosylase